MTMFTGFGIVTYYLVEKERKEEIARKEGREKHFGKPKLGGPFSLVDMNGVPVTNLTFAGQYVLLYFGFTYCPDICPHELVKLGRVVEKLDTLNLKHKVLPIFISLDPKRDSVAQLKEYCKDFHPRMLALTGTPGQVEKACRSYRVFYQNTNETKVRYRSFLPIHSVLSSLFFFKQQQLLFTVIDIMCVCVCVCVCGDSIYFIMLFYIYTTYTNVMYLHVHYRRMRMIIWSTIASSHILSVLMENL
jgi:cytochrome oxidase Cu insertion factor (SCO1/SenC/PrrC family)